MKNFHIVFQNQANTIRLFVGLGLIIFTLFSCYKEHDPVEKVERKQTVYPDTVKTGYDLHLCSLRENDWHPIPQRDIKLYKNLEFEMYTSGKLKAKGRYSVKNDKVTFIFNSENFKDTCRAFYRKENQTWQFWIGQPASLFVNKQDYLKIGVEEARKQLSKVIWRNSADSAGKEYIVIENRGKFKWDGFALCINSKTCDLPFILRNKAAFRYPKFDGVWSSVSLGQGMKNRVKLEEAVQKHGEIFDTKRLSIMEIYIKAKLTCLGEIIEVDYVPISNAGN
ncbi:MAG: hypothetical protein ACKV1O_16040 [Saprospiraceae bacterium]